MDETSENDLSDLCQRLDRLEEHLGIYYDDIWDEYRKIEQ